MNGIKISSEMIFGIGGGLGLSVLKGKVKHLEYLMLIGRNMNCEKNFLDRLGIEYSVFTNHEKDDNLPEIMKKEIDNNGIFVQLDRFYLDYLPIKKAHFGMHAIVVVDYNDKTKEVDVFDSLLDGMQKISYTNLNKAMNEKLDIFPPEGIFISINQKRIEKDITYEYVKKYLFEDCIQILNEYDKSLQQITSKLDEISEFNDEKLKSILINFQISYICQLILEEEPSRSFYRNVFAEYLEYISLKFKDSKLMLFADEFKELACKWTNLAYTCKDINNKEKCKVFKEKLSLIFLKEKLILRNIIEYIQK